MSGWIEARCIGNTGAHLGPRTDRVFHTDRTSYNIRVGSVYRVVGMGIWDTALMVLIRDDTDKPSWKPIGLFEIEPSTFPRNWQFSLIDGIAASGGDASNRWVAMWGYKELIADPKHSDALIERDPHALEIFNRQEKMSIMTDDERRLGVTISGLNSSPPFVVNDHGDLHVLDSSEHTGVEIYDAMHFEYFDAEGRKLRPIVEGYQVALELDADANPEPDRLRDLIQTYIEKAMRQRKTRPSDQELADAVLRCSNLPDSITALSRFIEARESRRLLGRIGTRKKRT